MQFAVCIVAVAPLRKESAHRSEMVSAILLGEFVEVMEVQKDFIKVKCLFDGYEGWCQRVQLGFTDKVTETTEFYTTTEKAVLINDKPVTVSIGTPYYEQPLQTQHHLLKFEAKTIVKTSENIFTGDKLKTYTNEFLNTAYLWGGKSAFRIDCSGFVQTVFKLFNIRLPRDAYQQAECGVAVGFLQEVKCGDLAFFDNDEGRITHVGILLDTETIIHASGNVRIDKIDNAGIISSDTGERTHKLRLIKRVV